MIDSIIEDKIIKGVFIEIKMDKAMNQQKRGLSIIIPVYNEEKILVENIERIIAYMKGFNISYEIILGSNGSTDKTVQLGNQLMKKYKQIVFFSFPKKSVGLVFKKAVNISRYNHLVSFDIDLSSDISFIESSLRLLNNYDIIIGAKILGTQNRSLSRRTLSLIHLSLVKTFLKLRYNDYSISTKAYKKSVIKKYLKDMVNDSSYIDIILFLATLDNLRIYETPINCFDNRESRFNLLSESFLKLKTLLRLYIKRLSKPAK